uniref:NADH-ubiquinone oxidoreductase chain 6 n=1 Tax=Cryptobranchus alleganiensis TaxID=43048 RepID=C9DHL0_CRYAE|nr:NADH dehydrogenase subunit 6 [Cryptobranchus alleganiensis]
MFYLGFLSMYGFIIGLASMASNPSPYFGALGLVLASVCGCSVLVEFGISFLSLILMLIYLGGMLVVFAYSASLAAEPYPEAWGGWFVGMYLMFYFFFLMGGYYIMKVGVDIDITFCDCLIEFSISGLDWGGVGGVYSFGWLFLIYSGWVLFLALFVVLEVIRGASRGALRAV